MNRSSNKNVTVRLLDAPAFTVVGRKTWIGGPDNNQFSVFWDQCRQDGTLPRLSQIRDSRPGPVTSGALLGISRVEADPTNRSFWFEISVEVSVEVSAEVSSESDPVDLMVSTVPACRWVIFSTRGSLPQALIDAEMFAFGTWLPASGYQHAAAPEMEVYPTTSAVEGDGTPVEFWLPVTASTAQ